MFYIYRIHMSLGYSIENEDEWPAITKKLKYKWIEDNIKVATQNVRGIRNQEKNSKNV